MRLLLALLMLLVPAIAQAQVVKLVRRECQLMQCSEVIGSGVIVKRYEEQDGGRTYNILTAHHLCGAPGIRSLFRSGGDCRLVVHSKIAGKYPTKIVFVNEQAMLMLLSCYVPPGVQDLPVAAIADRIPQAGEPVWIHGFSYTRQCEYGSRSITLRMVSDSIFQTNSPFEQGESGGPILDVEGNVVGICDGFYRDQKNVGYGASVIAIRRFLRMSPAGTPRRDYQRIGEDAGQLPVQPRVPVYSPPEQVRVREPIADAPPFERNPVYNPGPVVPPPPAEPVDTKPAVPVPEQRTQPDPIATPDTPAIPRIPTSTPKEPTQLAGDQHQGGIAGTASIDPVSAQPTVESKVVTAAKFGLDLWSVLAGVGLVAGTGGVGAVALWGWRGLKAARALKQMRQGWGGPSTAPPSPVSQQVRDVINTLPTQAPVTQFTAPDQPTQQPIRLPLQSANFVEIPVDYRRESVDYALAETGRKYPGAIATLEVVKSLINQHLQANGHGPESLHS